MSFDLPAVRSFLKGWQENLCRELAAWDGAGRFARDDWQRPEGGGGCTRVLAGGALFEKAGVAFSHVHGARLPPASSAHRPELAGKPWEAIGVSLVLHPRNPFVPTTHANLRFFVAGNGEAGPTWWFGGGMDLTPYYGFVDDAVQWHRAARGAVEPFQPGLYARFKRTCDDYFFLRHRQEARGVGGLFFDDFHELGFEASFALVRAVADAFLAGYGPIVRRRRDTPHGEAERNFQLYRRGRYVEFNLVQDRGTLFGLQSGGRTESILMSLPPLVRWEYGFAAAPGSPEAALTEFFLVPRDWLAPALAADAVVSAA